ncbi:MAG: hypothetical protein KatS3mg057_1138 [Herpetosiphonaceae bacterium]|nr:MAG: hypothetical protein KatS3mg057_1138 [Herpetosiphonaceae bacterium]
MYFDAITMEAIISELRQELSGGRVQRVLLVSDGGIGLEIFAHGRRHHLLLSAHPQTSAHSPCLR